MYVCMYVQYLCMHVHMYYMYCFIRQVQFDLPIYIALLRMYLLCSHLIHYLITDTLLRLAGGNSFNEGRVEVNYNGEWGTVCDDGWDDNDAGVVCRQLGLGLSGLSIYSASFGKGSGIIFLSNVLCTGSELILARCGHLGVTYTGSCSHNDDAGVICLGGQGLYRVNI